MGFEPEVENVPVPGQGLRRVRNLPLVSAIGFSGKSLSFFYFFFLSNMEFKVEKTIPQEYTCSHQNVIFIYYLLKYLCTMKYIFKSFAYHIVMNVTISNKI